MNKDNESPSTIGEATARLELTITLDAASATVICKALKAFYDDLYSGDPAGRILRARADYIRGAIEDGLSDGDGEVVLATSPSREAAYEAVVEALRGLATDLFERDGSGLCWCPLNHLTELNYFEDTGEHSERCKAARVALADAVEKG